LRIPVTMKVVKKEPMKDGVRITVEVDGPTHIDVMISPVLGVELTEWSLNTKRPLAGPKWNGRDTYFIYYAYGLKRVPLKFSMDFKVSTLVLTICILQIIINIIINQEGESKKSEKLEAVKNIK